MSKYLKLFVTFAFIFAIVALLHSNTQPKINPIFIKSDQMEVSDKPYHVALISDLHIKPSTDALEGLSDLWGDVISQRPDVILLAGDYIDKGGSNHSIAEIRQQIADILGSSGEIPVIAVLGNHDHWSNGDLWRQHLFNKGIIVLENQVLVQKDIGICIRGLGDAFTNNFKYIDFPSDCEGLLKLTLTHDPAAAFHPEMQGVIFAGHTHCGQIVIPWFGALYVPTEAPKEAHCGMYKDEKIQLFVSSGIGTSILPLRLNTQAEWDFITITK